MNRLSFHPLTLLILTMIAFVFNFQKIAPSTDIFKNILELTHKPKAIRLALLLDTSNSMDGLIEQAKSQLWNITLELSQMRYGKDNVPDLYIALYEYGNDRLSGRKGFIRQIVPFSSDMDLISEKLFALRTDGGSEYCGMVIREALRELDWEDKDGGLKMIYIAGNEAFTQGSVYYGGVCRDAHERDIVVNTIFCGDYQEGIRTSWKSGADLAHGSYFNIDMDRKTVYIPSPYDDRIEYLNRQLNDTYVPYGSEGMGFQENQVQQDRNAKKIGIGNSVNRAVFKSSKMYKAESWDLVDAYAADESIIKKESELPENIKQMSENEIIAYLESKSKTRTSIQKEIGELQQKRQEYIGTRENKAEEGNDLQQSVLETIRKQAKLKGFAYN